MMFEFVKLVIIIILNKLILMIYNIIMKKDMKYIYTDDNLSYYIIINKEPSMILII